MKLRHAGHSRGRREKGEREGGRDGGKAGRCLLAQAGGQRLAHAVPGQRRLAQAGASTGWRKLVAAFVSEASLCRPSTEQLQNNYRTTTEQLTEQLQNNS